MIRKVQHILPKIYFKVLKKYCIWQISNSKMKYFAFLIYEVKFYFDFFPSLSFNKNLPTLVNLFIDGTERPCS